MDLGEILFAMSQKIASYAKSEFDGCGIPLTLRPVIMECASKQIIQNALDSVIAGKLATQNEQNHEAGKAASGQRTEKKTRSGVGIYSLKHSLDEDFGMGCKNSHQKTQIADSGETVEKPTEVREDDDL